MISVESYLERIGLRDHRGAPSAGGLRELMAAHLWTVPFENVDIIEGRPIVLQIDALLDKVVTRRRGGFCYELGECFRWLLTQLGYSVTRLEAQVMGADGALGPPFDHLTLEVRAAGLEPVLVDVGFGEAPRSPLALVDGAKVNDLGMTWTLSEHGAQWRLERTDQPDGYTFSRVSRELGEFEAMCETHQTSADSPFTRRLRCTLATPTGRVTLIGGDAPELITTEHGERRREPVSDVAHMLARRFWTVPGLS